MSHFKAKQADIKSIAPVSKQMRIYEVKSAHSETAVKTPKLKPFQYQGFLWLVFPEMRPQLKIFPRKNNITVDKKDNFEGERV